MAPPNQKATTAKYKAELRRAIRRNAQEPEVNFLNITAMLDIMTIILVFLLKSLGESSGSVPQSDDLRLPLSVLKTEASQTGVIVTITKTQILVGDNKVVNLPTRDSMVQTGAGEKNKPSANSMRITPLSNALEQAGKTDLMIRQRRGEKDAVAEAVIIADANTPYRLLVEVMFTLGQNQFGTYHLMVMQAND